jgi:hypothetical protein
VLILFSGGHGPGYPKKISPGVPASAALQSPGSNVPPDTLESTSSSDLPVPSEHPSTISLLRQAEMIW